MLILVYDVVVVGAGPAGSAAARFCAEHGLKTLLVEEHAAVGYPVQCAGLLSVSAFEVCRVSVRSILNEVRGARMVSGLGGEVCFDAGKTKAYVVDRAVLDREMAEEAARAGAELRLKTYVAGIRDGNLLTRGLGGREEIPFRLLIAADGPRSSIARMLGMERSSIYLSGVQADLPCEIDPRYVEVHPNASPDFFGWVIPVNNRRARVGLCSGAFTKERFAAFARQYPAGCVHLVSGTIPLGVMPRTYGHKTLFVGDAAGFAKPTSGGGVYTGVRSAEHAACVASACCEKGMFNDGALREYETRWWQDFGKELSVGLKLLKMRQAMTPEEIDRLCRVMDDPEILETIVRFGDMDRPSALVRRLAVKPSFLKAAGVIFASGLRHILKN
nr:NAD(P)/FAD-dependent oxidoreductase [Methanoculleus taiwanensis]